MRHSQSDENCLVLSEFFQHGEKALQGSRLKSLQISKVRFTSPCEWWKDIPYCLRSNNILRELTLENCPLSMENAKCLLEGIAENSYLETLGLNGTSLPDGLSSTIARMLSNNATLKALSLRNNHLTDEGAVDITYGLDFNSSLTSLDLTGNNITETGSEMLSQHICHRKSPFSLNPSIWILRGKRKAIFCVQSIFHHHYKG